ncbi:DUF4476 domain-containing protein [Polyangium fumosum]|uniref:DUF4476 domain-containing protein n=1 Tax=Polyangium fumosum TaxID=889272 RepID=A0A4U1J2V2_9BACT|nr:DUF4476 domain-containing protein [Polyangium fumosum]TKD01333.1 DUF4476 domain-containing protein [Polyangium fumosum]
MKKYATILAFCAPLLGPAMEARADVGIDASFQAQMQMRTPAQMRTPVQWQPPVQVQPPVQTAPPAVRPYGPRSVPRPQYGPVPTPRRYGYASPGYTELRIAPAFGGMAWIYDGDTLVGSIEGRPGVLFVPEGRAYGVVMTRGDRRVWQGHVQATPGVVALSLDRYGAPLVERIPPPPSHGGYPPPAFELEQPLSAIPFRTTMADLEALRDDRSRLAFLGEVFGNRAVTVGQAHDLIARFAFEESRLRALELLAPNLVGRGDASRLLDDFVSYEGRARAAAILRLP